MIVKNENQFRFLLRYIFFLKYKIKEILNLRTTFTNKKIFINVNIKTLKYYFDFNN